MNDEDLLTYGLIMMAAELPDEDKHAAFVELPPPDRKRVVQLLEQLNEAIRDALAPFMVVIHHHDHEDGTQCEGHPIDALFGSITDAMAVAEAIVFKGASLGSALTLRVHGKDGREVASVGGTLIPVEQTEIGGIVVGGDKPVVH